MEEEEEEAVCSAEDVPEHDFCFIASPNMRKYFCRGHYSDHKCTEAEIETAQRHIASKCSHLLIFTQGTKLLRFLTWVALEFHFE